MPTETPSKERILEIRKVLGLNDSCTETELCAVLGKSRRALRRMNLPFRRAGTTRIHDLNEVREVIAA
jgi:hypothetical protein